MGHYSRTIDFITVPLTYPSLTLSKCPCQPLIHLIPWLSILTAFGQKGQYFLWRVPECYNIDSKKRKRKERKRKWRSRLHKECCEDGNMMYCNHMLPVGFIKFSLFTHSQAYFKCTHKKRYASAHTRTGGNGARTQQTQSYISYKHTFSPLFPLSSSPWWNRGCHAVTVCARRTNKCFPPRRGNLNGKTTWQLCHIIKHHTHSYTPQLLFGKLFTVRIIHINYKSSQKPSVWFRMFFCLPWQLFGFFQSSDIYTLIIRFSKL